MKIPPDLNLVRFTGFGGGAFVPTPKGFERAEVLEGDHQRYAVRVGFRLAPCPAGHGFDRGCERCAPFHGAVALPDYSDAAVRRRLSAGRRARTFGRHA